MKTLRRVLAGLGCLLGMLATANAWPSIEWTSAPSEAGHGEAYYVQAHGWSDSGTLSGVAVWKEWSPFSFNGGGDGWNEWAGNPASDGGEQWITYMAEAFDADGPSGVTYYTIRIRPPNTVPTITWTSAPAEAEHGQGYFIQAHGRDVDGNLTGVAVWKEWNPHAFTGGGDGWNEWAGNPSSDAGEQTITFMADSCDGAGNQAGVIYHPIHIKPPPAQNRPVVYWDDAPSWVALGSYYHIQAHGEDPEGDMQCVLIWRNGQPFAFELNGDGFYAMSENGGYGDASGQVQYMAEAYDSQAMGAAIYHTVNVSNTVPMSWISPSWPGQTVGINQPYTITAEANDPDNNLERMVVSWYAYEIMPDGTYVPRWAEGPMDVVLSNGGQPINKTYNLVGGKPHKWEYTFHAVARDIGDAWSFVWFGNSSRTQLDNHRPSDPVLTSTQTTIGLGQSVVITSFVTDVNSNLTDHFLWYQKPSEAGTENWHYLDQHAMPQGEGNSTITYTFTPDELGTYKIKTRANDPYISSVELTVAQFTVQDHTPPNPPTNVRAGGVFSDRIQVLWDLSNSNDVTSYRLYWQPVAGGALNNVTLGINTVGYWVTFLTNNTGYRFYLRAYDGAGNESALSNEVQATTAFSSTDWDGDGVPDVVEILFGTNPQNKGVTDPINATLQLKIIKP